MKKGLCCKFKKINLLITQIICKFLKILLIGFSLDKKFQPDPLQNSLNLRPFHADLFRN